MDDLTKKRLHDQVSAVVGTMQPKLHDAVDSVNPTNNPHTVTADQILNAELEKIGVPPGADFGHAFHWGGFVIGNMVSFGCSQTDCHELLAVAHAFDPATPYGMESIKKIPPGLQTKMCPGHELTTAHVYRWARYWRVALTELYLGLAEDAKDFVASELAGRAYRALELLIDTMHPVFSAQVHAAKAGGRM